MSQPTLLEVLRAATGPAFILGMAIQSYFLTLARVLRGDVPVASLRSEAFSHWWSRMSPPLTASNKNAPPSPMSAEIPGLLQEAYGDILEIGPGTGTTFKWLNTANIKSLYGIEPTVELHSKLRQSAEIIGLQDKLHILVCSGEASSLIPGLSAAGLPVTDGPTFDTIISIRSFCSVANPEANLKTYYELLHPGGRFLIYEHVVNPWPESSGSLVGRVMQTLYHCLGWSYFLGNCKLTVDTVGMLMDVAGPDGSWAKMRVKRLGNWTPMPHVAGVFVKKSAM